ncbi:HNH endonuclease [Oscillospiraceae bacterium OttesenSCG-928-G22]|nr:HNH endonuclease [Oscillospiraceae bacterium OttesenSCG-928-G22]
MELWKDIPGFEGRYQASNQGRIKSLQRKVRCHNGYRTVTERILRPACTKSDPHLSVVLGKGQPGALVHYLVAITFLGPRPDGMDICHIDGNPINNSVENLRYDSRTENIKDVLRVGKKWRKLTLKDVAEIRAALANGTTGSRLAKEYGVSDTTISAIKRGRTFAWIP